MAATAAACEEIERQQGEVYATRAEALTRLAGQHLARAQGLMAEATVPDEDGADAIDRLEEPYTNALFYRTEARRVADLHWVRFGEEAARAG